jgi:hypothetical protein
MNFKDKLTLRTEQPQGYKNFKDRATSRIEKT